MRGKLIAVSQIARSEETVNNALEQLRALVMALVPIA
jgi:hypothetical protein